VRVSLIVTTAHLTDFGDSQRCWVVDWLVIGGQIAGNNRGKFRVMELRL
jgi:hypothetical protein